MSLRKRLGKLVLCVVLQLGACSGANIRPEDIEQLMKMSQSQVVQVVRRESPPDGGDED